MPRPLLKTAQKHQASNILNTTYKQEVKRQIDDIDQMSLGRILRKRRSKGYMDMFHMLDAGGHIHDQDKINNMIDMIKKEFPEVELEGILLGYVSKCYLGRPFEVHILDISGGIIEHYMEGQVLPNGMEKVRGLAVYGGYDVIEVYTDCYRAISANGTVSVIPC